MIWFVTTIFSATLCYNISTTLTPNGCNIVPTLFQNCRAVMCQKSSFWIVSCKITFTFVHVYMLPRLKLVTYPLFKHFTYSKLKYYFFMWRFSARVFLITKDYWHTCLSAFVDTQMTPPYQNLLGNLTIMQMKFKLSNCKTLTININS